MRVIGKRSKSRVVPIVPAVAQAQAGGTSPGNAPAKGTPAAIGFAKKNGAEPDALEEK